MSGIYGNGVFNDAAGVPFFGATSTKDGIAGSVPKPLVGDQNKFLKGDGTWSGLGAPTGYQMIQNNGMPLPQQTNVNFIGAMVVDDTANNRTNVTIPPFPFIDVTTDVTLTPGVGYTISGSGIIELTLPNAIPYGSIIEIIGTGQAGWKLKQSGGQKIIFSVSTTTTGTGGFAASTSNTDCIRLVCIKANQTLAITSSIGTININ